MPGRTEDSKRALVPAQNLLHALCSAGFLSPADNLAVDIDQTCNPGLIKCSYRFRIPGLTESIHMKSHPWEELADGSKDFFDAGSFTPEAEFDDEPLDKNTQRRRLTDLRRSTEERLDWKRMYGDLQFDEMDDDRFMRDSDYADSYDESTDDVIDD